MVVLAGEGGEETKPISNLWRIDSLHQVCGLLSRAYAQKQQTWCWGILPGKYAKNRRFQLVRVVLNRGG